MVLHMSAQFMHMAPHLPISPVIMVPSAHIVQACSQAEQASIISFIAAMPTPDIVIPAIFMPGIVIMESIILEVMFIMGVLPSWALASRGNAGNRTVNSLYDEMLRRSVAAGQSHLAQYPSELDWMNEPEHLEDPHFAHFIHGVDFSYIELSRIDAGYDHRAGHSRFPRREAQNAHLPDGRQLLVRVLGQPHHEPAGRRHRHWPALGETRGRGDGLGR
jgi:hypothetical protein